MRRVVVGLAVAVVAATPAIASDLPPGGSFFDDDGNVHEGSIEAIAALGITRGCTEPDLYCPERAVTRGEMAAFLARALALPRSESSDPFGDDDGSIFQADIGAIAAAGITRGCDRRRFCPDAVVTRGQMAAFLRRALVLPPAPSAGFVDVDASRFENDIDAIAHAGITRGCNPPANDRYCPAEPVSRDQMASFLARSLGLEPIVPSPRPAVRLSFSGDVLIHAPVWRRAADNGRPYDFRPMFEPVAAYLGDADLAICHLEVPLSPTSEDLSGYPTFNAPAEVGEALARAGYDGCSTASNHSYDQGVAGVEGTLEVLAAAGLGPAGMAAAPHQAGAALYEVNGTTVAHLSATWWLNGFRLPTDKPWLVQLLDVDELLAHAADARAAGAELVVVSMHCCVEYVAAPTPYQRETARALIASPYVDLVIGHHAHVVQPIEEVDGEYIVYGVGNFLSAQHRRPATQDGVIVTVEMAARGERWMARAIEAIPTWVEPISYRILPAAQANPASWRRTAFALRSEGVEEVEVIR